MKPLYGLVTGDSCTKRDPSSRHINVNWPNGAVQAILQILELRAATKQKRIDSDAHSSDSAPESCDISTLKTRSKAGKPYQS